MRMGLILCHGWGFDSTFFGLLAEQLSAFRVINCDLGYFDHEKPCDPDSLELDAGLSWIGIGHSFGFSKLLSSGIDFRGVVCIQGFKNFFSDIPGLRLTRMRILELMKYRFTRSPLREVKRFHEQCGVLNVDLVNKTLNLSRLMRDLDCLGQVVILGDYPTLVIAGEGDTVVPLAVIEDNFINQNNVHVIVKSCSGHLLGNRESVYGDIVNFIKQHSAC